MVKKAKKIKSTSPSKAKWVYSFEETPRTDKQSLKNLLGGKGANLSEMIKIKLPVPRDLQSQRKLATSFIN